MKSKEMFYSALVSLIGIFLTCQTVRARAAEPSTFHGMYLFGENHFYLSHLPMFHAPHDYQVVVEVAFRQGGPQNAQALYLADKKSTKETLYTFVPDNFSMPGIASGKVTTLKADLYRGHFERQSVLLASDVILDIKNVVHFRKFDPKAIKPATQEALLFGSMGELFLAHFITARPDFDQVVSVSPAGTFAVGSSPVGSFSLAQKISLPLQNTDRPLQSGVTIPARGLGLPEGSALKVNEVLYTETSDLGH